MTDCSLAQGFVDAANLHGGYKAYSMLEEAQRRGEVCSLTLHNNRESFTFWDESALDVSFDEKWTFSKRD